MGDSLVVAAIVVGKFLMGICRLIGKLFRLLFGGIRQIVAAVNQRKEM